ncbi:uncharacterized protein [Blastocystis hominis]|uniref:Uncharacterized protein n=1 Tax=Blastocystis hominis TaxID=12968 RepID=D8MAH2_BLAHO|nr:uncharacterized protein [Blastocystis hominis]CBK25061.2 unnamed protein product [Blastocystis hominis]|eukprot:XP_012899109.1 uncharacterized protein [Blastocystis hominis]
MDQNLKESALLAWSGDALIVFSCNMLIYLMLLMYRFGETPIYKEETLTRELFNKLCIKLQEKTGIEVFVEKKKQNEQVDRDELLEYCEVLYIFAATRDPQTYISPILQLSESYQSVLMKIYEEFSGGTDKPDNAMIKELQSLEDENTQIKEQLALLKKDYELSQQQLEQKTHDYENRLLEEGSRNDELIQQIQEMQKEIAKMKQSLASSDSIREDYEKQQVQLQMLRQENEALSHQQEQGIKTSMQLEKYKAKAKELQEQCKDVDQLKNELARLRKTELDFVQMQIDMQNLQGQLDTEKRANETLAAKYSQIVNENETLRAAKIGSEAEASRLRQVLKESMIEMNESSLKRTKEPRTVFDLNEERDKLEERVHALEHDKQNQQTKTEVAVLSQQMEALEKSEKNWRSFSKMMVLKKGSDSLRRFLFHIMCLNYSEYQHIQEDFDKERQARLDLTQVLQAESARLRESINHLKEEREKDALEKERLLKEKEEEFYTEKTNWEKKQAEFKLQMDERISTLSSQLEHLQQELDSKQQTLSKQNSLIEYGKTQLRSLQQKVEEATNAAATAQKEREVLSTKNKQLNREVFLLRHEKKQPEPSSLSQNEEYIMLLKENENLLRRLKSYESGQNESTRCVDVLNDRGHIARSLDNRLKALENENSELSMVKSQLLQNKHILEQQLNEVMEECSKLREKSTQFELQLRVKGSGVMIMA